MSRNDLPSEKASNFSARLRETVQTMLGTRGDKLDRVVTLRDLIESGITKLSPGWRPGGTGAVPLLPGLEVATPYEPDLTPPPTPDGFTVSAAISHIFIEHASPLYPQGHGHLRTRVYGSTVEAGDPLPTFGDAVEITQFSGTVFAHASNPATTWRLWIKWETNDGVLSASPAGGTNGLEAVTGQDVTKMVEAMTGPGNPFTVLAEETVIDGVTFPAGTYSTRAFIIDAQITNAKIANLAVDDAKIANLSVSKLTAGSIAVGEHIQSTGYIADSAGWRINGDGTAEFSGVVVRGTVYASAGLIGGVTIASNAVHAGQTAFDTGNGFHLGADGKFSLGNGTQRLTWDGSGLTIKGALDGATGTFSGALSAATGTFAGSLSAATGTFSGALSAATGSFSGALSAATGTFSGALTADAVNAVNTINLAGQAVTIPVSAYTGAEVETSGTYFTLQTASIASSGAPLFLFFNCGRRSEMVGAGAESLIERLQVLRDATVLYDEIVERNGVATAIYPSPIIAVSLSDSPSAGAHDYTVRAYAENKTLNYKTFFKARSLFLIEVKR